MKTSLNDTEFTSIDSSEQAQANSGHRLRLVAANDADAGTPPQQAAVMEDEIRSFLADIFFLGDDPGSIPASKSLIEGGVIDSTGVLELIGFLEEQYAIQIDDDELLPENLDSIDNIVQFVTRKHAAH
jgi:acyl carrier protein